MPRIRKQSQFEQQLAAEKEAQWAAIDANPERFRQLLKAEQDAHDIYSEINSQYTPLKDARFAAENLEYELRQVGLHSEAATVANLRNIIVACIEPILKPLHEAGQKYEAARKAFRDEYPSL